MFEIKQEEENFLEVQKNNFPSLKIEDVRIKWITFLCHEEMEAQGDIDEHLFFSHGLNTTELIDEKKIELNEKSNLILPEARNIKNLSQNSFEKLMESWYETAVANRILDDDKGRKKDRVMSEKSTSLIAAISEAVGSAIEETFKIKLRNKIKGNPDVETGFTCKWIVIEETIKDILGQSPNIERLSQYLDKENWGATTLQQALNQINIFHENNLNNKSNVYKNENGSIKDYEMNKKSMKIMSAVKLIEELPETFEPVKQKLLNYMSNAFFDPEIPYEDVVKETEEEAANRGLTVIFSETKIKNNQPFPIIRTQRKYTRKMEEKQSLSI